MIAYIAILFTASIFSFCYSFSKDKNAIFVFKCLTFVTLFLPAALRYRIGTDYDNYVRIINMGILQNDYSVFEIGWIPIIKMIGKNYLSMQWFFIFPVFFEYFALFKILKRKYFFITIPFYILTAYLSTYSLVRQAFAATIFLLAFKYWMEKKYIKSIIWAVISCFFHKSCVLLCLILPFSTIYSQKLTKYGKYKETFLFLVIYLFFSILDVATFILQNIASFTAYAAYATNAFSKETEMGSGLGILLRIMSLFILIIACTKKLNNSVNNLSFESQVFNRSCQMTKLISFGMIIFLLLSVKIHIFNRLPNLIEPFYCVGLQTVAMSSSKHRKIYIYILLLIWFILYISVLKNNPSSASGGLGIVPYKSIF